MQDAFAAVRFLRWNAGRYGGDPDRLAALGMSAGATLAMMVAYCDRPDEVFGDCGDPGVSTKLGAVVNLYGPRDLSYGFEKARWWIKPLLRQFMGCGEEEDAERWRQASPFDHIREGAPPTVTVHGVRDTVVGFEQAKLLDRRLREVGTPHVLVPIEAGHAWGYSFGGRDSYALLPVVTTFLVRTLEHGSAIPTEHDVGSAVRTIRNATAADAADAKWSAQRTLR